MQSQQAQIQPILNPPPSEERLNDERTNHWRGRAVQELKCLRCDTKMMFVGRKMFHEGTRWGVLGDLAEVFVNKESFHVFHCPSCGKVEFFVPPVSEPMEEEPASTAEEVERNRVRRLMAQYEAAYRRKIEKGPD